VVSSSEQANHASFDTQWWLNAQHSAPVPKIMIVADVELSSSSSVGDCCAHHPSHHHEHQSSPDRNTKKQVTFDLDGIIVWNTPTSVSRFSKPAAASRRKFFKRRRKRRKHHEESSETGSETSSQLTPVPPPSTSSKTIKGVLKVKTPGPVLQGTASSLSVPRVKATSLFVGEDVKVTPLLVGMMPIIIEDGNDDVDGSNFSCNGTTSEDEAGGDDEDNHEVGALCCGGSEWTCSLSDPKAQGKDRSLDVIIEDEWGNIEVKFAEGVPQKCYKNFLQEFTLQDNEMREGAPSQEIVQEGFWMDDIRIVDKILDAEHDQSFESTSTADLSFDFSIDTSQDQGSLSAKEWTDEISLCNKPVLASESDNYLELVATDSSRRLHCLSIDEAGVFDSLQPSNLDLTKQPIAISSSNRGTLPLCELLQRVNGKTYGNATMIHEQLEARLVFPAKVIDDYNGQAILLTDFFAKLGEFPRQIMALITLQLIGILLKLSGPLNEEQFI